MRLPERVELREVGLRDGLQSRPDVVPTGVKAEVLRRLVAAGFRKINAVALVNPRLMPQVGDSEALLEAVGPVEGVTVSGLVLNRRGLERAIALAGNGLLDEVQFLHATTSGVLVANSLPSEIAVNQAGVLEMARAASAEGLRTLVFLSASFGCSIEGPVAPDVPQGIAEELVASGVVDEICFSDSTGQAVPVQVHEFFERAADRLPGVPLTAHFHDTRGVALANVLALLELGLGRLTIDAAFGGLGGDVPFLPEASGNVCTEDLVSMLERSGVSTGIDLAGVLRAVELVEPYLSDGIRDSHVRRFGPGIGAAAGVSV
jgi:isopropylmalate/homocitrate/citramalate synthase